MDAGRSSGYSLSQQVMSAVAASLRLEDLAVDPYPHLAELRSQGGRCVGAEPGHVGGRRVRRRGVRAARPGAIHERLAEVPDPGDLRPPDAVGRGRGTETPQAGLPGALHRQGLTRGLAAVGSTGFAWTSCGPAKRWPPSGAVEVDLMADYAAPIALETMGHRGRPAVRGPAAGAGLVRSPRPVAGELRRRRRRSSRRTGGCGRDARVPRERGWTGSGQPATLERFSEVLSGPGGTLARSEVLARTCWTRILLRRHRDDRVG